MDATVDDFLNEINELVPLKEDTSAWQECFDDKSGFHYYWNTKTDEVTWSKPDEYQPMKKSNKPFLPPQRVQVPPAAVKIYKIGDTNQPISLNGNSFKDKPKSKPPTKPPQKDPGKPVGRFKKPSSDSEDEKIVLISSYGGDTESESDEDDNSTKKSDSTRRSPLGGFKKPATTGPLFPIQTQPNANKEIKTESNVASQPAKKLNTIAGFSLVAGYSDSEDEEENEEVKTIFPLPQPQTVENKVSHSTLFPITKPIDVKDFMEHQEQEKVKEETTQKADFVDVKAFQRKRRIGIDLVNNSKKPKEDNEEGLERKGFGFSSEGAKTNTYPGFQKGGVLFIKSDVLNPASEEVKRDESDETGGKTRKQVEDLYTTLKEKLGFLSEGRSEVSPVQVMIIQAEMLFLAMKEGGLKQTYLEKWLKETCSDLIKLEKEATPDGWSLKWDRSHKRYYYQNDSTGEGQWEYPQPDVVRCDEAMDISTTPPPPDELETPRVGDEPRSDGADVLSPPLPPNIQCPTPPPPPLISQENGTQAVMQDVPLPPDPKKSHNQPLPPGVDPPTNTDKKKDQPISESLTTALDSFYSDIAAIENSNSPPVPPEETKVEAVDKLTESGKKKKKTKVKLTQGLSMKKKGVSKLVEKWKNVQLGLDN